MSDDKRRRVEVRIEIERVTLYSLTKTLSTLVNVARRTAIWAGLLGASVALVWAPPPAPSFGLAGVCVCAAWACMAMVGHLWKE